MSLKMLFYDFNNESYGSFKLLKKTAFKGPNNSSI